MIIVIQGDWESGKTSFMNMIKEEGDDKKLKQFGSTYGSFLSLI